MRYLDELARNVVAELRFWLGYRLQDRGPLRLRASRS